jgi:hypothetical protein
MLMSDAKGMNTSPHFVLTPEMRELFKQFDDSSLTQVNLRMLPAGKKVSFLTSSWSVYEITLNEQLLVVKPVFSKVLKQEESFDLNEWSADWIHFGGFILLGNSWRAPDGMVTNRVASILVH